MVIPPKDIIGRLHAFAGMFPSGPLWVSHWGRALSGQQLRKIIYGIAAEAKLEGVHPHRFRAFYATQYIEQFKDIQALQGVLGHTSIETTSRYSQWTREARGAAQMQRFTVAGAEHLTPSMTLDSLDREVLSAS
jgi:site-specific recombinase XerD